MAVSHGSGAFHPSQFARLGDSVVFEPGVLVFHPETIEIDRDVYIGHYAILKGYHRNRMIIGAGSWVGQQCFLHSAGGLTIGVDVGIGPGVRVLTSSHTLAEREKPILRSTITFAPVSLEDGCDVGVSAVILPGVRVGRGAQVGAGSVVVSDVPDYAVVAGVPARLIRMRD